MVKAFKFFIGFFFLSLPLILTAQSIQYPVTNYTNKEYGRDFHPSNLSIAQDRRGLIYIANGFHLLEFDGYHWNAYPINKSTWILSVAIGSSGTIYIGSQNEFGYFSPDSSGRLQYHSLSDSLKGADRNFTNVWKVHATSSGIFFQAEEKLFLFSHGKIRVILPETSFHTSFVVRGVLYIRQRDIGLMKWESNGLKKIPGSELFKTTGIFAMVPFPGKNRDILIATRENGFWVYHPLDNSFSSFHANDNLLLKNAGILGGILLHDSCFALNTSDKGLIIMDQNGRVLEKMDQHYGLPVNEIHEVTEDHQQNIWAATGNGISRIDYSSPLSFYGEPEGIHGRINAIVRFQNRLYLGTPGGLLVQQSGNVLSFSPLREFSRPVWALVVAENTLFAGSDDGLYKINGNNAFKINASPVFTLFYSEGLNLLFSGGAHGLTVYGNGPFWKNMHPLQQITADIIRIAEGKNNHGITDIWIGTRYEGVFRLKYKGTQNVRFDKYTTNDGLTEGPVLPFSLGDSVIFGTISGTQKFTDESAVIKTLPDSLKNDPQFARGIFNELHFGGDKQGKPVSHLIQTRSKLWVCIDNQVGFYDNHKNSRSVMQPFRSIDAGNINVIFPDQDGICWIGTTDGLIRFDEKKTKFYSFPDKALVRSISVLHDNRTLYYGTNSGNRTEGEQPEFTIPYRSNSLRFDFAVPSYEYTGKLVFSCQLEGFEKGWTPWDHRYYQEYTNLHEGNYTFHVKAKNVYGEESNEAIIRFVILPPWYRSLPAYFGWGITTILLIWLVVRLYSYRLKRENIRLEGIVKERTAEVVKQKDEIEKKNEVLGRQKNEIEQQKDEIEGSIRYASRIQTAVIPSEDNLHQLFPESFVLFKPLNIVSGDFYWTGKVDGKTIVTAADCTGHGVPGAFMSMLGIAFLNEIINKDKITEPDQILNRLRNMIIAALQQQGIAGESKDGMDIAMVAVDEQHQTLQFAGAYNPLVLVRGQELTEVNGDKMPIAIYENMPPFTRHDVSLKKGDCLYMFSDGYADQFGGSEGKKFKWKRFRQLLSGLSAYDMPTQKNILNKTIEDWKGKSPQIDDMVVIGIRI